MAKCCKCGKSVAKKSPGIQCGKCCKWLHATCASITNEQLAMLSETEAVEWKCRECCLSDKKKRVSIILPEPDDYNIDTEIATDYTGLDPASQKVLSTVLLTIRREIRDTIQEEIQRTLQYYSDKIDDYQTVIDTYEEKIKTMENQYKDLQNKYINVKNNLESINSKINLIEQQNMENTLEITGIQKTDQENIIKIVQKVSEKLKQDPKDIIKMYRKENKTSTYKKDNSIIVVNLRDGRRDQWLDSAKSTTLTHTIIGLEGEGRIYLREALTPTTAFLLWKTKTELKDTNIVKFVWCKKGKVLVRKSENEKIFIVRSENDIKKWASVLDK